MAKKAGSISDIANATVFVDLNGDGVKNDNEISIVADQNGNFSIKGKAAQLKGDIVVSGGTNIATGEVNDKVYTAPSTSKVVNALTTMVAEIAKSEGVSSKAALKMVAETFEMPVKSLSILLKKDSADVLETAPANSSLATMAAKALEVGKQIDTLMTLGASVLSGAAGDTEIGALHGGVLGALASQITAGKPLDLSNAATMTDLIKSAGANAGLDTTQLAKVDSLAADAATVITATMAKITATVAVASSAPTGAGFADMLGALQNVEKVAASVATHLEDAVVSGNLASVVTNFTGTALDSLVQAPATLPPAGGTTTPPAGGTTTPPPAAGGDVGGGGGGGDVGGGGNDTAPGGDGGDWEDQFAQVIRGTSANETLTGGDGNDLIYGGDGNDSIVGGGGDDHLVGEGGNDSISGGDGWDYISYWLESLEDKELDQTLNEAGDEISIKDGNTLLLTVKKNGDGTTTVTGHNAAASLGTDTLDDTVDVVGMGNYIRLAPEVHGSWADGTDFNDTLDMATIFAGRGDGDHLDLRGGEGDDTLTGRDQVGGKDWFNGGEGNDSIDGKSGIDGYNLWLGDTAGPATLASFANNTATINVGGEAAFTIAKNENGSFTVTGLGAYADEGTDTLTNIEQIQIDTGNYATRLELNLTETKGTNAWGSKYLNGGLFSGAIDATTAFQNNTAYIEINGDSASNRITGDAGQSNIWSGTGNDTIDGGAGLDTHRTQISIDAALEVVSGDNGTVLIRTVEATPQTLFTIATTDGTTTITAAQSGAVDTLTNVETLWFHNYAFDDQGQRTRDQQLTLNLATTVDGSNQLYVSDGSIDATALFTASNYIPASGSNKYIHDDSLASQVTGTVAHDTFYWSGGNDSFDGGAGNDTARLGSSYAYATPLSVTTDANGTTLVKDGETTVATISAPDDDDNFTFSYAGNTLTLSNVESVALWAYPQSSGGGREYKLNLGTFVGNKAAYVGAGSFNITTLLSPDSGDWITIYDDLRDATITGSDARDNLTWSGGNDSFDGGAGVDGVRIESSINIASLNIAAGANGATEIRDGNTVRMTLSAADGGITTLTSAQGQLAMKNVEKLDFYVNGSQQSLYLATYVDGQQVYAAGNVSITTALVSDYGVNSYVTINDDARSATINGGSGSDTLYWNGGNDTFLAGTAGTGNNGNDYVRMDNVRVDGTTTVTTNAGVTQLKVGDSVVMTINSTAGTVAYNGSTLTTTGVEKLAVSTYAATANYQGLNYSYEFNMADASLTSQSYNTNATGDINVGTLLGGTVVTGGYISDWNGATTRTIVGSAFGDGFEWRGGNDSFDGAGGRDYVNQFYNGSLTSSTSGNVTTLKNGETTAFTITDNGNGSATVTSSAYANQTLSLSNVETFQVNTSNQSFEFYLADRIDGSSAYFGGSSFNAGTALGHNYNNLQDDIRNTAITGGNGNDTLSWRGGDDSFSGGSGTDTVSFYGMLVDTASAASGGSFNLLDGNTVVGTVTSSGGNIVINYEGRGTLTLTGVETLSLNGSSVDLTTVFNV